MPFRRIASAILSTLAATMVAGAQGQPAAPAPDRPTFESYSTAILVDVVVRNRQGRPVTDLTAADFEIREDGVLQTLGSFTRVSRGGGIGINVAVREPGTTTLIETAPAAGGEAAVEPEPFPSVTALVFDALSAEAVALCQRAALESLPMTAVPDARVGVFVTEPAVMALQTYTDDPALVRRAVSRVMPAGSSAKPEYERLAALRERRESLDREAERAQALQATGGGAGLAGTASNIGQLEMNRRLAIGELRMLQTFDAMDRDQRGQSTTRALFAILQSLVELRGRKTLIFFSEGLPASPALQANLQAVVEAANRANITVYAIDATGLRVISGTLETQREIEEAAKERLRQLASASNYTDQPIMRIVERTEDLMRLDSHSGLARLAEDTGGFLVRDTNNLRGAFQRIDEDTRFHYLLTYAPTNTDFDGSFRSIKVKVTRPGVEVFARSGYRALRNPPPLPVLSYEAPAIAALDATTLANGFPFSTAVLSFPERDRPGLSPLIVRLKTDVLTYEERPDKGVYDAAATVVARFRDARDEVVHKVSQQYQLSGRLGELEAARRGEILFYREPTLDPGVYTVEVAVVDGLGGRVSTRVSTLNVPRVGARELGMSSVVIVGKAERVTEGRDPGNPLYVGELLFYPNAGEPVSRAGDRQVVFYYTVYPGAGFTSLEAEVELQRNGRVITRIPMTMGEPDGLGRVQQVGRLPLAPLTPGTYELRVHVRDGRTALTRSAFFSVRD